MSTRILGQVRKRLVVCRKENRRLRRALYYTTRDLCALARVMGEVTNGTVRMSDLVEFLRHHYPSEVVRILPEPLRRVGLASMELVISQEPKCRKK